MTTASALRIRRAVEADVEDVVRIYVDSWNEGFVPQLAPIEADSDRTGRWRGTLRSPGRTRWWIAERAGAPVGFAGIGPSRDPRDDTLGELDTIAVAPCAWRTGVGRALMAPVLDALRSDGYRAALLWTLADYPRGAGFYEASGWRRSDQTRQDGLQVRYDHALGD